MFMSTALHGHDSSTGEGTEVVSTPEHRDINLQSKHPLHTLGAAGELIQFVSLQYLQSDFIILLFFVL